MKKSKILVPAVALLALGMAASTTATIAWFQAGAITPTAGSTQTGTIVSKTDVDSLGSFTVNITALHVSPDTVSLTNAAGDTYLYNGTTNVKVAEQANKFATVTVDFSIVYSGDAATADGVLALWNQSFAAHPVTVKAEDKSHTYTAQTLPTHTPAYTLCHANGGLKFSASSGDAAIASVVSQDLTGVSAALGSGLSTFVKDGNNWTATKSAAATFYVGIAGVDNAYQYATDYYEMLVSPVIA